MKVVHVNSDESSWDSFVHASEQGTSYHRFRWRKIISDSFGHESYYLAAIDQDGSWRGVLPLVHMRSRLFGNFIVSMPFVNYGGVLSKNKEASRLLLEEAEQLRTRVNASYVELRHLGRGLERLPTRKHKVTMTLDLLTDSDRQWRSFNAKLRNQIRKAEKSRLTCVVGHLELLDGFYDVFVRNMRDLGTPAYGKDFFRKVLETFSESTIVIAVFYEEKTIAAGIGSWFRDSLEIPWASSVNDYKALCPNNMLYWEAIRFAIEKGFRKLDFGRSTPNEGTFNFKKQWGAVPVQLHWQYLQEQDRTLPNLSPSNPKYRAAARLWQRLPLPFTNWLGPRIVRNIP